MLKPSSLRLLAVWSLVLFSVAGETPAPLPFPDMMPTVGLVLEHDYYDPSRFKPRIMVERALRALEDNEISIDTSWSGGEIALNIAGAIQKVPAPEPKSLREAMAILEQVRLILEQAPAFTVKERRDLTYAMANGALLSLDPHTLILPPEPAREFSEEIQGEFFGIGAFLAQEEGIISIERVMPGLPAERAGVEDGDVIVGIDGEKTVGLSLEQAVRRIKGPKGTTVVLSVERKGVPKPTEISIVRDLVQVITVRSFRDGDVGYVRMDEFNGNTAKDLYQAILELQSGGPLQGFVLDLRFNGGGLLEQAKIISDFFLPKDKEIVRTVTVGGDPVIAKSSSRQLLDVPMVVLTSGGSASAAEILSGALQENDRAVIAGSTTFGKGSVQSIKPLRDNSRLKLTIQEYQLPKGVSIQDVGVTPDLKLVRHGVRENGTVDMVPFTGSREVDDEFALGAKNTYQHAISYELGWLARFQTKEELRKSAISAKKFSPDQESRLVIDLLKAAVATPDAAAKVAAAKANNTLRQLTLELLKQPVAARSEIEAAALGEALAKLAPPIAWGPDAAPAAKALSLEFIGPDTVTAGDKAKLGFTVHNAGGEVGRLYGVVHADKSGPLHEPDRFSPLWEEEVVIGDVAANGSATGSLAMSVPPRLFAGEERFTLELHRDGHPEALATLPVKLNIKALPRPHFSYRWELQSPAAAGQLKPGEAATVSLTLINDGVGASAPIDLRVFKDNDAYVQLGEGRFKLEPLAPGATITVAVPLTVLAEIKRAGKPVPFAAAEIKLQLRAEERFADDVVSLYRASLFHTLTIPVNQPVMGRTIIQPALSLVDVQQSAEGKVHLKVQVKDDNPKFIALFQDEDKIDLELPAALGADGTYQVDFTLKPGLNSVRVVVTDTDKVSDLLPLRLWGPPGPAVEPAAAAAPVVIKPAQPEAVIP